MSIEQKKSVQGRCRVYFYSPLALARVTPDDRGMGLSVFEYTSATEYLAVAFAQKKAERPQYSLRSWARTLNAGHVTSLARAVSGKDKIPKKMILALAKNLRLSPLEQAYFEVLCWGESHLTEESFKLIRAALRQHGSTAND